MTDLTKLPAGGNHRRAYVGPPLQYDFMGATQFRLLTTLGLRESHTVLDVGCGSLRAGRLLLPYLEPGNYFGIEPNKWLIDEIIAEELTADFVTKRQPRFEHNERFDVSAFNCTFDFIVAQSIFSHTGSDLLKHALVNLRPAMNDRTVFLATFIHPRDIGPNAAWGRDTSGWLYPACCKFTRNEIHDALTKTGYAAQELPWYHPRQTWWLLTLDAELLLKPGELDHLSGRVLRDDRFQYPY